MEKPVLGFWEATRHRRIEMFKMFKATTITVALSACATTGGAWDGEHAAHARIQLESAQVAEHTDSAGFPEVIDPQLPSADRIATRLRDFGGGATAHVQLCVAPDGHVASLKLERGSMLGSFDQAVLHDAAMWQFQPGAKAACEHAAISYQPHS
jgi:hypothetical protein